jgi:hypothetical protein
MGETMLHKEQPTWFILGRVIATGAAGATLLWGALWGASPNRLNLNENPQYARRPSHTICNSSAITNMADPQEDSSFLAACDLDCVQCAKGKCSNATSSRCELINASKAAGEVDRTPWNATGQFGPSLYFMTNAGEQPSSLVMSLPEEMQIIVVEAPDGANLFTADGTPVRVIMRVDQQGPMTSGSQASSRK